MDERGILALTRAQKIARMLQFVLDTGGVQGFPPAVSDGHVAGGLSSATYEAIITSCWVWLALYQICGEDSYNHRAVSTLCNESFNSDLLRIDKDGTSAPKAANIVKIMAKVVVVNALKHSTEKGYHLLMTNCNVYPFHPNETLLELSRVKQTNFADHPFDVPDLNHLKRKDASKDIKRDGPQRGARGVRQHFHVDETKILPEKKQGKGVKLSNSPSDSFRCRSGNTCLVE